MECLVCQAPAAGLHYQATCCRACAAFFRRTLTKKVRYMCSENENCDVTNKNRYTCRYCRLKKCIKVGMTNTDDPTTSFEFHLVSKSSSDLIMPLLPAEEKRTDFYSIENIFGNPKFFIEFKDRVEGVLKKNYEKPNLPFAMTMCQQISAAYYNLTEKWPNCKKGRPIQEGFWDMNQITIDFFKGMETAAEFCMEIRDFATLPFEQKCAVFKHLAARLPQIFLIFTSVDILGHDVEEFKLVSPSGAIFDYDSSFLNPTDVANLPPLELREAMIQTEYHVNTVFIKPFKRLHADSFEKSFIIACAMWLFEGFDGISPSTFTIAAGIRSRLADELDFYYKHQKNMKNYGSRIYKLLNLVTSLDRVAEMRERDGLMSKTFDMFKVDVYLSEMLAAM